MAYHPRFSPDEPVRIANRATLDEFFRSYKLHHPLQVVQLEYAGQIAKVIRASMYHGGDQLYELKGIPGIWHENLLETPPPNSN
jgi:hypothetical protein